MGLDVTAEVEGRAAGQGREGSLTPNREGLVGFEGRITAVEDDFARIEAGTGDAQGTRALLAELGRAGEGADAKGVSDDVNDLSG